MDAFERSRAEVRTKRAWLFVAQLPAALPFVVLMPRLAPYAREYFVGSLITLATVVTLGQMWQRWPRVRRADVRADAAGLHLDGRLAVARTAIRTAHVQSQGGATFVRLVRSLRPVDIFVADEEEGHALIAALRLAPAHSVVRYRMMGGSSGRVLLRCGIMILAHVALTVASVSLFFVAGAAVAVVTGALALIGLVIAAVREHLTLSVGADGVQARQWLGSARFWRYSEMKDVRADGTNVTLGLHDGQTLTMCLGAGERIRWFTGSERQEEGDGLVARVAAGIEASRSNDDASVRASLARGTRPTEEWHGRLVSELHG